MGFQHDISVKIYFLEKDYDDAGKIDESGSFRDLSEEQTEAVKKYFNSRTNGLLDRHLEIINTVYTPELIESTAQKCTDEFKEKHPDAGEKAYENFKKAYLDIIAMQGRRMSKFVGWAEDAESKHLYVHCGSVDMTMEFYKSIDVFKEMSKDLSLAVYIQYNSYTTFERKEIVFLNGENVYDLDSSLYWNTDKIRYLKKYEK